MTEPRRHFTHPPVTELAIGVQFAPLVGMAEAHVGWFWRDELGADWTRVMQAAPIPDQFEQFDGPAGWAAPGLTLLLGTGSDTRRVLLMTATGEYMVQVQQTRFTFNWRRVAGADYPRYHAVRGRFDELFGRFREFAAGLPDAGPVRVNQWELTYVDEFDRGTLWSTPADWPAILPGLFPDVRPGGGLAPDGIGGEWHYAIPATRGRVHVRAETLPVPPDRPTLRMTTTARGPSDGEDWGPGLDLGHDAVLKVFLAVTSDAAKKSWG